MLDLVAREASRPDPLEVDVVTLAAHLYGERAAVDFQPERVQIGAHPPGVEGENGRSDRQQCRYRPSEPGCHRDPEADQSERQQEGAQPPPAVGDSATRRAVEALHDFSSRRARGCASR